MPTKTQSRPAPETYTLTGWLGGKPTIPGVYLRHFPLYDLYARWTGEKWMAGSHSLEKANSSVCETLYSEFRPWRGIKGKA